MEFPKEWNVVLTHLYATKHYNELKWNKINSISLVIMKANKLLQF